MLGQKTKSESKEFVKAFLGLHWYQEKRDVDLQHLGNMERLHENISEQLKDWEVISLRQDHPDRFSNDTGSSEERDGMVSRKKDRDLRLLTPEYLDHVIPVITRHLKGAYAEK